MIPVKFKHQNLIYGEKQEEYLPLPAYRHCDGTVVSRWKLSLIEWLVVVFTGKIYLSQSTFGSKLQPARLHVEFDYEKELCVNCGDPIIDHKFPDYYCPKQIQDLNSNGK